MKKQKPSEIFEGENSSLRKTFEEVGRFEPELVGLSLEWQVYNKERVGKMLGLILSAPFPILALHHAMLNVNNQGIKQGLEMAKSVLPEDDDLVIPETIGAGQTQDALRIGKAYGRNLALSQSHDAISKLINENI